MLTSRARASRDRWAVFISGTGSNLSALLDERHVIDVGLVVSSTPKAYGLVRARRAGVPALILEKTINWTELDLKLRDYNIQKIFLMGFMKLLPPAFVEQWKDRIFNIHPSLLPAFPGLQSIQKAYVAQAPIGVTVHKVIAEMDAGPRVFQRNIGDIKQLELDSCEFMVHLSEHRLVRESIRKCRTEQI